MAVHASDRCPAAITLAVGATASLVTVTLLPLLAGSAAMAAKAAVLCAVMVACTWNAGLLAAPILAGIAWLLFNGFVESTSGQLHWYAADPGWLLALLLAATALPALRLIGDVQRRPRSAAVPALPVGTATGEWVADRPRVSCRPPYGRRSPAAGSSRAMPAVASRRRLLSSRAPLAPCPRVQGGALTPTAGTEREDTGVVAQGQLRIYLGAAPGVGKTYAMLTEGHRRAGRGADVVVAAVDPRGRPETAALLDGLPSVPERAPATVAQLNFAAVLRRRPEVALVDDLAARNPAGSRHPYRWQDVEELLAAGISVISTVNIAELESLRDVAAAITGVPPAETVPDDVVRRAEQVELVDMAPEALRRRLAHGHIYGADEIDAAMAHYFRLGNLTALRELSLSWLTGTVDRALLNYRAEHEIADVWETRERVVVALSGGPEGEQLARRAARLTARSGGELLAVHVTQWDGPESTAGSLAAQRALVESLGGSFHQVVGDDVPTGIVHFARAENATQIVVGASHRSPLRTALHGAGVGARTLQLVGSVDVHLVAGRAAPSRQLPSVTRGVTQRRQLLGLLAAAGILLLLTIAVTNLRSGLNLPSEMLLYLLATVVVALIGGVYPALTAAVASSLLLNWFFTPPFHTFKIEDRNNALALLVFIMVAASVSAVVDLAARRSSQAARATAEAETLTVLAGSVLRGDDALPALLNRLRETFGMTSVRLLQRTGDEDGDPRWVPVLSSGVPLSGEPAGERTELPTGNDHRLVLHGRPLSPADRRLVGAFAAQAAVVLDRRRLAAAVEAAKPLAAVDRVRTALLTAVSHDLRTPLASAIAAVSSLRSREITWTGEETSELVATADESLARLARLVENLLDMSRLQAGAISVFPRPTALEEVVPVALDSLGPIGRHITVDVPASLPPVLADPALLERVIANLAANAVRHAPDAAVPPRVAASALGDRVELRIIDRGPGIPMGGRDRVFAPFQRLGDTDNTAGVGLGLALARGLAEAMGGTVTPEDTPAGGLTMVVSLPAATAASVAVRERTERW